MTEQKIRRSLAPVFDQLIAEHRAKNDAAIARATQLSPSTISKARAFSTTVSGRIILRIHEAYGMPIAAIKAAIVTKTGD
jgi:transcriptional regulator with XRE-family HTH domain